jgi:hypothetical protein
VKYTDDYNRIREIFFALCKSVDSPVALGAWLRFQHNQLALAEMEIKAADYLSSSQFELDYAIVSFLSKYKGLQTGMNLESEALQRFTTSEEVCRESNIRIKGARKNGIDPFVSSVLWLAKRKIAKLLGPYCSSLHTERYGWGPGATDDMRRRNAFADSKLYHLPISVTPKALPYIRRAIGQDLHWSSVILEVDVKDLMGPFCFLPHVFKLTNECVIDTVPKNAKTHRVIAKEPRANGFLQKGIGSYIRSRLKRVGINLDSQVANQEGAKHAYELALATLDLKAASDSMPIELVFELLPIEWAQALDAMRSPSALLPDGKKITLQKFSSMGNGFTFELETLIFWAIASSVIHQNRSNGTVCLVYGDDIIVNSGNAEDVIRCLAFCGFQTNKEKSFIHGAFYESCGKHFFEGRDVTPVYQKSPIAAEVEILRCGNRIIRLAGRLRRDCKLRKELQAPWDTARRIGKLSRSFQLPYGTEGDDGWVLPASHFSTRPQDVNLGIRCRVIRTPPLKTFPGHEGALLALTLRRGVVTQIPFNGTVTSSPDTTELDHRLLVGGRWVMPTGEFGLDW